MGLLLHLFPQHHHDSNDYKPKDPVPNEVHNFVIGYRSGSDEYNSPCCRESVPRGTQKTVRCGIDDTCDQGYDETHYYCIQECIFRDITSSLFFAGTLKHFD